MTVRDVHYRRIVFFSHRGRKRLLLVSETAFGDSIWSSNLDPNVPFPLVSYGVYIDSILRPFLAVHFTRIACTCTPHCKLLIRLLQSSSAPRHRSSTRFSHAHVVMQFLREKNVAFGQIRPTKYAPPAAEIHRVPSRAIEPTEAQPFKWHTACGFAIQRCFKLHYTLAFYIGVDSTINLHKFS